MMRRKGRNQMLGGVRASAGRRPVKIDLLELEKLSSLMCTDEEVAAFFGVSVRTIENRRKQPKFAQAMGRGKAKGRISLRRLQMRIAEGGSPLMSIWLGKQCLGQTDVVTNEHTGKDGSPVQIIIQGDEAKL